MSVFIEKTHGKITCDECRNSEHFIIENCFFEELEEKIIENLSNSKSETEPWGPFAWEIDDQFVTCCECGLQQAEITAEDRCAEEEAFFKTRLVRE